MKNIKQSYTRVEYFAAAWRHQRDAQLIAEVADSHDTVAVLEPSDLEQVLAYVARLEKVEAAMEKVFQGLDMLDGADESDVDHARNKVMQGFSEYKAIVVAERAAT